MKTCINNKLHRLTLERMVIGLEEPILIKGIGELLAKIDSGNSGYNVIHGEDFIIQGNILNFKTINKDGDERRVSKKIKETLRVNIGGGHIQERPVIELDIKFGGDDYKKIPFSVTNRADNEHKVLISKDFVGKELDALIDVTKDNIANDDINVDYVAEGIMDAIKGTAKTAGNIVSTFATGTEKQQKWADKMANIRRAMEGERIAPLTDKKKEPSEADVKLEEEVAALAKIGQLIDNDIQLIKSQLSAQAGKFPPDFNASLEHEVQGTDKNGQPVVNLESNVNVQKLLDYMGNTNIGSASSNPDYHQRMKDVLASWKRYKEKEESEEVIVSEAATPQPQQPNSQNRKKKVEDPTREIQGTQVEKEVGLLSKEEVNKELQNLQKRNRTIFYLISFTADANGNPLTTGPDLTKGVQNIIDSWSIKLVQEERWNKNSFIPFVSQLIRSVDKNAKGLFAICSNPMESRKVEFFTNPGLFYSNEEQTGADEESASLNELAETYTALNEEFKSLSGMELTDENIKSYATSVAASLYSDLLAYIENNPELKQVAIATTQKEDLNSYTLEDFATIIQTSQNQ